MVSVQDFEVPKGWNELKFFYKSECVWTIGQDDVKTDDYKFESMYEDNLAPDRKNAEIGDKIYNGKYEIVFQGVTEYVYNNIVLGDTPMIIFKYTVNNTGSEAIDYQFAGYNMAAYQNNYFLGDSQYILDEKIEGYSNIYNIDSIEAGMSANIYIAFDAFGKGGDLFMVYEDGYISEDIKGTVFVDR